MKPPGHIAGRWLGGKGSRPHCLRRCTGDLSLVDDGLFIGHGIQPRCGADGAKDPPSSSTATAAYPTYANEALHVFAVHELPADCTDPAATPSTAACLVGRFLRARSLPLTKASIRVLDRRTYFVVIPDEGSNAAEIGYPEMRVTKRSGVVAAWGRRDTLANRTPA
jgi:hypothetical protein